MSKDPRTLEAIEKIKTVLTEYDLVGFLVVISPERAHWVYHVDASWSALSIDSKTGQARVRAKRADFKTAEQHRRVLELTIHAIYQGRDLSAQQSSNMGALIKVLEQHLDIEHVSGVDVKIPLKTVRALTSAGLVIVRGCSDGDYIETTEKGKCVLNESRTGKQT